MARFVQAHPTYRRADIVAAVLPSNPNKQFDLPTYIVQEIAKATGQAVGSGSIRKVRATRPMKDCRTDEEKAENIRGAFAADVNEFGGKSIILVDDIYQTGSSINEVCRVMRGAGASLVLGRAARRAWQLVGQ
jgi:predicted amidophosphoribosyltransferase